MATSSDKRAGSPILAGLGGFLLGAATVLFILWLYKTPAGRDSGAVEDTGEDAPATSQTPPAPPPAEGVTEGSEDGRPWLRVPVPVPPGQLAERNLLVPVEGIRREQLLDTFGDARGGGSRAHQALDIMAPRGTQVLAVEDGKIQKLFESKQGGLTIYQFDPSETYAYYYAHLDRYADGLKEGQQVRKGQVLGEVGSTGNAGPDSPHLHFAIFRLTPEKKWWKGDPLNPFDVLRGQPPGREGGGEPSR